LEEGKHREAEADIVRELLEAAQKAHRAVPEMRKAKERLEELKERERRAKAHIENRRIALISRASSIQKQIATLTEVIAETMSMEGRLSALQGGAAEYDRWVADRENTRTEGLDIVSKLKAVEGRQEGTQEQRRKILRQLDYLSKETDGQCPTCGSQLTQEHRSRVDAELREEKADLERKLKEDSKVISELLSKQKTLRENWKKQNRKVRAIDLARTELSKLTERLAQAQRDKRTSSTLEAELELLRNKISTEDYAHADRHVLEKVIEERSGIVFDEQVFDKLLHTAAQVRRYTERKLLIDRWLERKPLVSRDLLRKKEEERKQRIALDDGTLFGIFQAKIKHFDERLHTSTFDAERLQVVRETLKSLGDVGSEMARLVAASENRERMWGRLKDAQRRTQRATLTKKEKRQQVKRINERIQGMGLVEAELQQSRGEREKLEQVLNGVRVVLGEVGERLAKAARERRELTGCRKKLKTAKREVHEYELLMQAFGKHGIPSLIIEETLPDIEYRTNALLERLSDGRMQVRIDTLRNKKKGGTIETLDIKINDDLGEFRAYETYSGGEAYRVNFALRIALSQLLAARSGVRVRMLVIDEGFGTQDPAGVQSLVEAISAVQEDFDKILVITHLREVKEAFPVRIEVRKLPGTGSQFEVFDG